MERQFLTTDTSHPCPFATRKPKLPFPRFYPLVTAKVCGLSVKGSHVLADREAGNVLQYEPHITRTIERLLEWMEKYSRNKAPMSLDEFFAYATFDVVGEVVFARPFGFLEEGTDIGNSVANSETLSFIAASASFFPRLRNLLISNPFMTWLGILPMGHVFNTTMTAVKEREKNFDSNSQFVIVDHWLRTLRQQPDRLNVRNVYAQATNNVGAGADTVNSALQSFFYHLLRNPVILEKARKEVDDAVFDGRCTSSVVSFSDAQQLHYVQACIKEALRFFTPVPSKQVPGAASISSDGFLLNPLSVSLLPHSLSSGPRSRGRLWANSSMLLHIFLQIPTLPCSPHLLLC